jgi:uncharacterized protein (DUF1800 family)
VILAQFSKLQELFIAPSHLPVYMGCISSSNALAPAAAEAAEAAHVVTTEVSANALPAAPREGAATDKTYTVVPTPVAESSNAVPASPSLIEGVLIYAK